MKITILGNDLALALSALGEVLPKRGRVALPVLSCIFVNASSQEGVIEMTATNLEYTATVKVRAQVERTGIVLVDGAALLDVPRIAKGQAVTIDETVTQVPAKPTPNIKDAPAKDATTEQRTITITAGTSLTRTIDHPIPVDEFPLIAHETEPLCTGTTADLVSLVTRVANCASEDNARPTFTGILLEFQQDKVTGVATDGYRLGITQIPLGSGPTAGTGRIVPAGAMKALIKAQAALGSAASFALYSHNTSPTVPVTMVTAKIGPLTFTTRTIEGQFINVAQIIPSDFNTTVSFVAKDWLTALAPGATLGTKKEKVVVKLSFTEGGRTLAATIRNLSDSDKGKIDVSLPIKDQKVSGDLAQIEGILLSHQYLTEVLRGLGAGGFLSLKHRSGATIALSDDGRTTYLVMPMTDPRDEAPEPVAEAASK